jgi:hypothetical protein
MGVACFTGAVIILLHIGDGKGASRKLNQALQSDVFANSDEAATAETLLQAYR